jgi:hypothetical protein
MAEGFVQKSPKLSSRIKRPATRTESRSTLSTHTLPILTSNSWSPSNPRLRNTSGSRSISRRLTAGHIPQSVARPSSMRSVWRGMEKVRPGAMEGMINSKMARGCCYGMAVDRRTLVVSLFPWAAGVGFDVSLLHRHFESRAAHCTS